MRGGSFWRVSWVAVLALGCEAGDSGGAGEVADVADVAVVLPDSEAVQADLGPILPDLGVVLPDVAGDAAVDVDAVFVPPTP
jgi:hypothetical protein